MYAHLPLGLCWLLKLGAEGGCHCTCTLSNYLPVRTRATMFYADCRDCGSVVLIPWSGLGMYASQSMGGAYKVPIFSSPLACMQAYHASFEQASRLGTYIHRCMCTPTLYRGFSSATCTTTSQRHASIQSGHNKKIQLLINHFVFRRSLPRYHLRSSLSCLRACSWLGLHPSAPGNAVKSSVLRHVAM